RSLDKLGMTEGKVARYALGYDYHDHIKKRLFTLADWLRTETPCETRVCVDTAPVLESEWAARSGIAWQGKNRLALSTTLGSYLLLGEILTTADLAGDAPATNRCGSCNACIDACPTDALSPYQIDPRRCISTWTIEHRGDDLPGDPHGWLFGCDICQEVCPWNRKAAPATDPRVQPRPGFEAGTLDAEAVLNWTQDDFRVATRGSAMRRVKLPQLQRNARAVLSNGRA
ncbi:MAG: tRNA epoxyqueuosine(34) reductase QueG, partial [Planctomycetota bacterium]